MKTKDKDNETTMPERMPPTLSLNEDDLPELKKWRVGKKYDILLRVEQVSSSKGDGYNGDGKKMEARFRVLSARVPNGDVEYEEEEEINPAITRAVKRKMHS